MSQPRSMRSTIQAVDQLPKPAGPSVERLAYSYRRGYEDGHTAGSRSAIPAYGVDSRCLRAGWRTYGSGDVGTQPWRDEPFRWLAQIAPKQH